MNAKERFLQMMDFGPGRTLKWEFGYWAAAIRRWYKEGLTRIDHRRPYLVNGADLEAFLRNRQEKRKRKCQPDELYCCRCRLPQRCKDGKVILRVLNQKVGRISGLCSECGARVNKAISLKKLENIRNVFKIVTTHETNLVVLDSPIVNTHLEEDVST